MIDLLNTACRFLVINENSVNAEVSFVTEAEIRELNRNARGIDKPTDVLSFPMLDLRAGEIPTAGAYPLDINPDTNKLELGDIIICHAFAKMSVDFLTVHGFLHLLGYDHQTDEDHAAMTQMTEDILRRYKNNE